MSGWTFAGVVLLVSGAVLGAPGIMLVGALTLVSRWLITFWSRFGLSSIEYRRRLATRRALWGDEVGLDVQVWNRKPLPVPLLVVDDHVTDRLTVAGRRLEPSDRPGQGSLRLAWSLLWFEEVVRHLTIQAHRRGVFDFGPIRLTVSDLFERGVRSEDRELSDQLVVRPRTVPVRAAQPARAPLGSVRVKSSLFSDPARYAGVRPFQPGDPLRRIHWRAAARLGRPVSRRYEPITERQVLLAVDVQTVPGPHWLMLYSDDLVEGLCVAAASLVRRLLGEGSACGLLLGAQLAGEGHWMYVAPATGPRQLGRLQDALARVQPIVTLPFEALLRAIPRLLAPGASVTVLGARDPQPYVDTLRRLDRSGYGVRHLALGDAEVAALAAERLTRVGIDSRRARLEPDWRRADALVVAA